MASEKESEQTEVISQEDSAKESSPVRESGHQLESSKEQHDTSVQDKRKARLDRLRELHLRRNEARKLNHVEVVEEDKRNKLPANWQARKRKIEWEVADEEARKQAELNGEDYEKVKMLETSAIELEKRERKKKKKNPDTGFADFAQAQHRQYERLTKQVEPNMEAYEKQKQEMGESFFPGVNTLIHESKPPEAAIDRMVEDLEKQIDKRSKYSRRRGINPDADVDYINDRNMRFNKKAARYYDKFTAEIKQNLERGTAV